MSSYRVFLPTNCKFHVIGTAPQHITLANSTLHFSDFQTVMERNLPNDREVSNLANALFHSETGFLEVPVSGDKNLRPEIARAEARRALAVMRFVAPAQFIGTEMRNPIKSIDILEAPYKSSLLLELSDADLWNWQYRYEEQFIVIHDSWLDEANEYGLDDLNYHSQNKGNAVSNRIVDALEFYDSGLTAASDWQEMYRYIASINIVLFGGSAKSGIQTKFEKIINATMNDIGAIGPTTIFEKTPSEKVSKLETFYDNRSHILHSMDANFSQTDVDEARHFAFNAIRAMAHAARRENFQSTDEITTWFKKLIL